MLTITPYPIMVGWLLKILLPSLTISIKEWHPLVEMTSFFFLFPLPFVCHAFAVSTEKEEPRSEWDLLSSASPTTSSTE